MDSKLFCHTPFYGVCQPKKNINFASINFLFLIRQPFQAVAKKQEIKKLLAGFTNRQIDIGAEYKTGSQPAGQRQDRVHGDQRA